MTEAASNANRPLDDAVASQQQPRWWELRHWLWSTWVATFLMAYAMWDVQTASFPAKAIARPSWFVYGWPLCFATSGRGRFNFSRGFETVDFIFDLMLSLILVACTAFAVEVLLRRFPRLNALDVVGIVVGVCVAVFVFSEEFNRFLTFAFGADLPRPTISPVAGDIRPLPRMSGYFHVTIALGMTAVGYTFVKLPWMPIDGFVPPGDDRPGLRSTWVPVKRPE